MALERITDHEARALGRLIAQYRSAVNLRGLVSVATTEHQVLEDVFWKLFIQNIDTAEGAELDVFGRIVGQPREGRGDPKYRLWVKTRVRINRSNGTVPEIVGVFTALVSGTSPVIVTEEYPAALIVTLVSLTHEIDPVEASAILQKMKPGGVRAVLVSPTSTDLLAFAFDPNGAGFGDTNDPNTGGQLATAI
jgi:hypothetical protein